MQPTTVRLIHSHFNRIEEKLFFTQYAFHKQKLADLTAMMVKRAQQEGDYWQSRRNKGAWAIEKNSSTAVDWRQPFQEIQKHSAQMHCKRRWKIYVHCGCLYSCQSGAWSLDYELLQGTSWMWRTLSLNFIQRVWNGKTQRRYTCLWRTWTT